MSGISSSFPECVKNITHLNRSSFGAIVTVLSATAVTALALGVLSLLNAYQVISLPGFNTISSGLTIHGQIALVATGSCLTVITGLLVALRVCPPTVPSRPNSVNNEISSSKSLEGSDPKTIPISGLSNVTNRKDDEGIEKENMRRCAEGLRGFSAESISEDTLQRAINTARALFDTDPEADSFFYDLVLSGKEHDVLMAKNAFIEICSNSKRYKKAYNLCYSILSKRVFSLLCIPLEVAKKGCLSEEVEHRDEAFRLFKNIVNHFGENKLCIDSLLECMLTESKRKSPSRELIFTLEKLINLKDLPDNVKASIESRRKKDATILNSILDNILTSQENYTFVFMQGTKLKNQLNEKLSIA